MTDVKWIKINVDIFDDEKFSIIDSMPEADAIEVMWFKLLVFAGRSNNNGIFFFNDRIAYTDEMLASVFRRPLNTVRLALNTFMNLGMIEEIDGVYTIPNWGKYQTLDAYEKKKERDREYQRIRREKQKQEIEDKKSSDNRLTVGRDCSYSNSNSNNTSISDNANYSEIVINIINYLNDRCNTHYKSTSKDTVKHIKARLNDGFTEDDFYTVIDKKADEWIGTEQEKFLRPMTLFGTKFESYLNQNIVNNWKHVNKTPSFEERLMNS